MLRNHIRLNRRQMTANLFRLLFGFQRMAERTVMPGMKSPIVSADQSQIMTHNSPHQLPHMEMNAKEGQNSNNQKRDDADMELMICNGIAVMMIRICRLLKQVGSKDFSCICLNFMQTFSGQIQHQPMLLLLFGYFSNIILQNRLPQVSGSRKYPEALLSIAEYDYRKTYAKLDDPLRFGLEHERYVTSLINTIYQAADAVHDYRTMQCFDWFVKEQGEEEKNAEDLIKKFELFGSDPKGLYALNQELLTRVYMAPSLVL